MSLESIKNYFTNLSSKNMIGHAYLIVNVDYDNLNFLVEEIINQKILNSKNIDNPNIYIIEPDKNVIKKEQIIELGKKISITSQIDSKKVYIIKKCEKLNDSSANALLKTLEEPGNNVIAFLLTNSVENVIPTIKSRCQLIYCDNVENEQKLEIKEKNYILDAIECLENQKTKVIAYKPDLFYNIKDKEEFSKVLILLEYFYKDCINVFSNRKLEVFKDEICLIEKINTNNNLKKIINKLKVISSNKELLELNVNLKTLIDKFLIEYGRIE